MTTKEIAKIKRAVRAIAKQHTDAHSNFDMLCDAHNDNMLFNAHTEALKIHSEMCVDGVMLTKKERNANKRRVVETATVFSASTNVNAQCYRIEIALNEFHTFQELLQLDTLKDVTKYRLRSHLNFLDNQFCHVCKKEVNGAAFRYVLI
jgi:hypothetical protein